MKAIKILLSSFLLCTEIAFSQTERIEFEAPDSYPEGIAYQRSADVFYVSSARTGTIGKVTRGGTYTVLHADSALKSSYGMKVDSVNNRLLVCIGDANYSKYAAPETYRKMARLIAVDLSTGQRRMDVDLSKLSGTQHFVNDLTIDNNGNIYLTDSYANVIYKVTSDGKAAVFADSPLFKTAGIGLNGIVWHRDGFLLASSTGKGCLFKVDLNNPGNVIKVGTEQFFMGADGLIFDKEMNLCLVQNQSSDKIYKLKSEDNWQSAKIIAVTLLVDRFSYPATAAVAGDEVWIMNAKFNELTEKNNVPSKKFAIQKAFFKPIPQTKKRGQQNTK